jgi:two-component system response regulator FixJ
MGVSGPHVYVVDDDVAVRKSLNFLLSTSGVRSWPFIDGKDFVAQLADLPPAPVLLDVRMAGVDGFGVLTELASRDIGWPVIMMTAHGDVPVAVRAMKQGAIEFLEKPFSVEDLESAITRGFALLEVYEEQQRTKNAARRRLESLTSRELEVMGELIKGAPNKLAAHHFGLSTRTIEMHRASAMAKLGLKSLAEAALLMAAADFIPPARESDL